MTSNRVEPAKSGDDYELPAYYSNSTGATQEDGPPQYPMCHQPYALYPPPAYTTTSQQQTFYVANQPAPMIVQQPTVGRQSFAGPITLSCFAFWCCGCLFGAIAFFVALAGRESSLTGNTDSARKLSRASYIVSIVGVIVGAIVITIVLSVMLTACFYPNCPHGWRYTSTSSCAVCCPDLDVLNCYY